MRQISRTLRLVYPAVFALAVAPAYAQEGEFIGGELVVVEANTLEQLLKNVEDRRVVENA